MPSTLTPAGELIKSSWLSFLKTWEITVRYSAWLILPAALALLSVFIPQRQELAFTTFVIAQTVISALIALWVSVCLYQVIVAQESGAKVTAQTTKNAWGLILPLLFIAVLQSLATLGALILFIIPGIYVGVRLGFSQVALFQKNARGRAALAASWALTKNRFWAVVWRELAGGVVFGLLIMVIAVAAMLLVGLVAGGTKLEVLLSTRKPDPLAAGALELVQSVIQAAFIPLLVIFQIKLYRALEKSR